MSSPHPSFVSGSTSDNPYITHLPSKHKSSVNSGVGYAPTEDIWRPKVGSGKSKSNFRLPRTKQHKKIRKSIVHATEIDMAATVRNDVLNKQFADCGVHIYPSTKTGSVKKALNGTYKELSGLRALEKDARKSCRWIKQDNKMSSSTAGTRGTCSSAKPVFGVSLDLSFSRNPSHDGVPLPAFFRHCIDYIEEYGLGSEGIYRVPGVNSQVQSLLTAIDNGEEFPYITPTSATFYQHQQQTHGRSNVRANSSPFVNLSGHDSIGRHKPLLTGVSDCKKLTSASHARLNTDGRSNSVIMSLTYPLIPHDPAVVASVVKHFLRNLPEPILTTRLLNSIESVPTDSPSAYHAIAKFIHSELPLSHRFLLAWMLQHITHIMDRSGENHMTLDNIIIVLSPCLRISHRLLAVLLSPAPSDLRIDFTEFGPPFPSPDTEVTKVDPSMRHWLFPHLVYQLRSYRPPLRSVPDLELPETDTELESELKKQESLLFHLHDQIGRGEATPEKEALLWETQHLVTELRRRKNLRDPETIRAELFRQQAQLDRLHKAIATETIYSGASQLSDPNASMQTIASSGMFPQSHRSSAEKPHKRSINPDELWEVQRQVTMLKRRLKRQEKLCSQQTNAPVSGSCATTCSTICGPIQLSIPTLSELDEEEVLNLTPRKLPTETPCNAATAHDLAVPTQMSLPDATLENPPVTSLPLADLSVRHRSPSLSRRMIQLDLDSETTKPEDLSQPMDIPDNEKLSSKQHLEVVELAESAHTEEKDDLNLAPNREEAVSVKTDQSQKEFGGDGLILRANNARSSAEPPSYSLSPGRTAQATAAVAEHQVARQMAFYTIRKQELQAIQTDLRARSWSENAEIHRILSCINHLLDTGDERLRQVYDAHFTSGHISSSQHFPALLNRSWVQMAMRLSADDCWSDKKELPLPVDGLTFSESLDLASSTSTDSQAVTYSRLNDREESLSGYSHEFGLAKELQACAPDNHSADDESEECEVELAKTLFQLTLDNARLEQLNVRYLEGIQAERNRCADLKVLLKLRANGRPVIVADHHGYTLGRSSQK